MRNLILSEIYFITGAGTAPACATTTTRDGATVKTCTCLKGKTMKITSSSKGTTMTCE